MEENNTTEDRVEITEHGKKFFIVLDDEDQDYINEYLVHKAEIVGEGFIKYSIYTNYFVLADWGDADEWSSLLTKTVKRDIPQNCIDDEDALHEHFVSSLSRLEFISLINEGKHHDAPEFEDEKTICLEDYKGYFTILGFEVDESRDYYELLMGDDFEIGDDWDEEETPDTPKGEVGPDGLPF